MSYCKDDGKDKVIFVTQEDHEKPSNVTLEEEDDEPGLILENGDINWNCPCLGGMATGPCGPDFREAFSCFHYSTEEPKGSECYEAFSKMQECMSNHQELYGNSKEESEAEEEEREMMEGEGFEEKNTTTEEGNTTSEEKSSKTDSSDNKNS